MLSAEDLATRCEYPNVDIKRFYDATEPKHATSLGLLSANAVPIETDLKPIRQALNECQLRLWRLQSHAVLVIIQGTDAAGKDSTIRHVLQGLNPAGVMVSAFKQLTPFERASYYLTRYSNALPARGCIQVFNRSMYEDVIMPVVYPESLALGGEAAKRLAKRRAQEILEWERSLQAENIAVIKFFLNVSHQAQAERLLARIDDPLKRYKFSLDDVESHAHYTEIQVASAQALNATHTAELPWYVIPADHKPTARWLLATILQSRLERLLRSEGATAAKAYGAGELPHAWRVAREALKRSID